MDAKLILEKIEGQRKLSNQVIQVVLGALRNIYYPALSPEEIRYSEIGSYGRGTNDDPEPDIDVMFLGIPNGPQQGFFNWIGRDTFEMTQSSDGMTSLSQVEEYDPKLAQAITETIRHMERRFGCEGQVRFNFVRSWSVFPGVVFSISAPIPGHGQLGFDINLYHKTEYFGVDHTQRFLHYLDRLESEYGDEAAAQLILDIRRVKHAAKEFARDPETGKIDKTKKIWGFLVEVLFTHLYPPPSREELSAAILKMDRASFPPMRPETNYNFPTQVIDENLSLKDVLDAGWEVGLFHAGNWETLMKAIESHA